MEQQHAEQAAFTLMKETSEGSDISRRYNSLSVDEQKQVFTEMKSLQADPQTMKLFGNVELFDSNHDGRMDDAISTGKKDGVRRDVYNDAGAPKEQAKNGEAKQDVAAQNDGKQIDVADAQAAKPMSRQEQNRQRYEQQMESMRNRVGHPSGTPDVTDRMQRTGEDVLRRGGQVVVDEVFRGMRNGGRGHGPSTSDRIEDRLGREGVNGANRILRNVLGGH